MRPCYLDGAQHALRVSLDGPALKVVAAARAPTLLPLARVSRVVVSGVVEWNTAALLACAERGIPVTFLRRDGAVRAHLFGTVAEQCGLLQRLRDFIDRPDWRERYRDWLRNAHSRARRALCRKLGLAPDALKLDAVSTLLTQRCARYLGAGQLRYLQRTLAGLCAALVAEQCHHAGLDAERCRYLQRDFDLIGDLAQLLALDLHVPLADWLAARPAQSALDERVVVQWFESHKPRLEHLSRSLISRLHGFLLELL